MSDRPKLPKKFTERSKRQAANRGGIDDRLSTITSAVLRINKQEVAHQTRHQETADQLKQVEAKLSQITKHLNDKISTVNNKLSSVAQKANDIRDMQSHQVTHIGRDHSTGRFYFSFAWGRKFLVFTLVATIILSLGANFIMARHLAKVSFTCQHILGFDEFATSDGRTGCGHFSEN